MSTIQGIPAVPEYIEDCSLGGGAILAADFNGDGKLDLATTYGYSGLAQATRTKPTFFVSGGYTSVFLGNGDGTFQPYINTSAYPGGVSLTAGDFNNDGKIDLASSSYPPYLGEDVEAYVSLGNGDGTFSEGFAENDQGPWVLGVQAAAADVNGDGNLDLLVCNSQNVSVMLGWVREMELCNLRSSLLVAATK